MNESQESCRAQYQCTCPEIDLLTELARDAGAVGSRVTGAGWGGCTVSMVAERDVDGFIKEVTAGYEKYHGLDEDRLKEVIFATKPSSGAAGTFLSIHLKFFEHDANSLSPLLVFKFTE